MIWKKIKDLFGQAKPNVPASSDQRYAFKWYDIGPENPFPVRILDVRSLTCTVIATTSNPAVAEKFATLRNSDGRDLISSIIPDAVWVSVNLRFPHNGAAIEGIAFKADSMDVKWDIYVYDNCLLFARSWTGDLGFRARIRIEPNAVTITEIQCPRTETEIAPSHVFFLVGAHLFGRVLPHRLPAGVPQEERSLAILSFSLFGNKACYATFEDITRIPINTPQSSPSPDN